MTDRELTANQREALEGLVWARKSGQGCREMGDGIRYCTPMDIGGSNGSHHSATLLALSKKGLADRYKFRGFGPRGSCAYRATDAGVALIAEMQRKDTITRAAATLAKGEGKV